MDIRSLSIGSIQEGLHARAFSAVELAREALRFAEAENPATNAYLHFSSERAMAAAARVDVSGVHVDAQRARLWSKSAASLRVPPVEIRSSTMTAILPSTSPTISIATRLIGGGAMFGDDGEIGTNTGSEVVGTRHASGVR